MNDSEQTPEKRQLDCPCGEHLEGTSQDDLIAKVREHLSKAHPDHQYSDEQILFIAY